MKKLKLAILDLYEGHPNQGMRAIREIVENYKNEFDYKIFDVRSKCEIPNITNFDVFISSGGPGNPLEGDGVWDKQWHDFLEAIWQHNKNTTEDKKYLFLICHSFQMAVHHFGLATVKERYSRSFGTFPCWKTDEGKKESFFAPLRNPFWIADFRNYQVVQPKVEIFESMGAKILAKEKIRHHVPMERAVMAIRFSNEIFGTQFHPEADPVGMIEHFSKEDQKDEIVGKYGLAKFQRMMEDLSDKEKIQKTSHTVIPSFLENAINELTCVPA